MIGSMVAKLLGKRAAGKPEAKPDLITQYISNGRIPWSPGYAKYKNRLLLETLGSAAAMRRFAEGEPLPTGYGYGVDERVVEIPWVLSRLRGAGRVLDAGSVLNTPWLLSQPALASRRVFIHSLELDQVSLHPRLSFVHGDFRERIFNSGVFESIVCISTLEHVGMWPIPKAPHADSLAKPQPQKDLQAYQGVLAEFRRLLAPGGQLLLTVPVGRKEDQDWLQIYSTADLNQFEIAFGAACTAKVFYLYRESGWNVANTQDCATAAYYNFVKTPELQPDRAAAARAVACLEFQRGL